MLVVNPRLIRGSQGRLKVPWAGGRCRRLIQISWNICGQSLITPYLHSIQAVLPQFRFYLSSFLWDGRQNCSTGQPRDVRLPAAENDSIWHTHTRRTSSVYSCVFSEISWLCAGLTMMISLTGRRSEKLLATTKQPSKEAPHLTKGKTSPPSLNPRSRSPQTKMQAEAGKSEPHEPLAPVLHR